MRVNHLGAVGSESLADGHDPAILHQYIGSQLLAQRRVHRQDVSAPDQGPRLVSGTCWSRIWSSILSSRTPSIARQSRRRTGGGGQSKKLLARDVFGHDPFPIALAML